MALELGLTGIRGDYSLPIFNDFSALMLLESEIQSLTLSPELTLKQIEAFQLWRQDRIGMFCAWQDAFNDYGTLYAR